MATNKGRISPGPFPYTRYGRSKTYVMRTKYGKRASKAESDEANTPVAGGLKGGPESVTSKSMDRDQINDMIGASEARGDTKLAVAMGEVREEFAKINGRFDTVGTKLDDLRSGQRNSFWALAAMIIAAIAIVVGVVTYGGSMFGIGLQSHDVLAEAAKEGAAQAIAQLPHTPK